MFEKLNRTQRYDAIFSTGLYSEAENPAFSIQRWKILPSVGARRDRLQIAFRQRTGDGEETSVQKGHISIINRKMISDSETNRPRPDKSLKPTIKQMRPAETEVHL